MKLTPVQRTLITDTLNDIYYKLEARLLGRFFRGPSMYFSVVSETEPELTLEGAYIYALKSLYGPSSAVDDHEIKSLSEITENYLEAARLKQVNQIIMDITGAESDRDLKRILTENIDKANSYVEKVVVTEARNMQAHAEKEGITRLAASIGDDDPTIVKLGIVDDKLCYACRTLWHDPTNPHKPRPWKLSELRDGYNKSQKDPIPTHASTHPHCRHVMSYIPSGRGFDASGVITFVDFGYNYYDEYYKVHKHESMMEESLLKSCTCSHLEELGEP